MMFVSSVGVAQNNMPTVWPNHSKIPEQKIFYGTAGIINPKHKTKPHLKHHKHPLIKKQKNDY